MFVIIRPLLSKFANCYYMGLCSANTLFNTLVCVAETLYDTSVREFDALMVVAYHFYRLDNLNDKIELNTLCCGYRASRKVGRG